MRILFIFFCSSILVACGDSTSSTVLFDNLTEQPVQTEEAEEAILTDTEADVDAETEASSEPSFDPNDPLLQSTGLVVANPNAFYADKLVPCISEADDAINCPLSDLPFLISDIKQRGDTIPTIDDIINRTVVSHPWMTVRLAEVLAKMPDDLLKLFGGVTAVVIAADIRPSHYSYKTGAIYLDPASFWLNIGEKQTIDTAPDFRSAYGKDLNFLSLFRYVIGNEYAWKYYPLDSTEERGMDDITLAVAYLLFHELAHANDFNLPAMVDGFDNSLTVYQALAVNFSQVASVQQEANQPLTSQIMFGLASVMFRGEAVTEEQRLLSPTDVGLEFEIDGASDDYAYNNKFEDTAMLFSEVMMKYHFGIDREIAYAPQRSDPDSVECSDLIVEWGYRNRVADPLVKSRAEFVVQKILSLTDVSAYFAALPSEPVSLINGIDWCTNLAMFGKDSSTSATLYKKPSSVKEFRKSDLLKPHQY